MKEKIKYRFNITREYLKEHKKVKWFIIFVIFIIGAGLGQSYLKAQEQKKLQAEIDKEASMAMKKTEEKELSTMDEEQIALENKFGKAPKGMIWRDDGQLRAVGDPDKKPEDVARLYMQAVTKLNFEQVEKYAYPSQVIKTFNRLYSEEAEYSATQQFRADVYKEVLKNMEVIGIEDYITTANNKVVYTFNVRVIDLSYKTFWQKDKDKIFADLKETTTRERDREKTRLYLYDYVGAYYKDKPSYKTTQVKLILQKSKKNGWVVVNDAEVDALGKYPDNDIANGPVGIIQDEFETWYQKIENVKPNYDGGNINRDENTEGKEITTGSDAKVTDDPYYNYMPGDSGEEIYNPFDHKGNAKKE